MTYHNILPLDIGLNKVGLPLVVTSSEPHLCFIIDTGATHNIVFSYVYEELPHCFSSLGDTSSMIEIEGVEKNVSLVETTLSFEDKDVTASFSVLDATDAVLQVQKESGIQIHGILGIPFLTQNKWILDFNKLTLQC